MAIQLKFVAKVS